MNAARLARIVRAIEGIAAAVYINARALRETLDDLQREPEWRTAQHCPRAESVLAGRWDRRARGDS